MCEDYCDYLKQLQVLEQDIGELPKMVSNANIIVIDNGSFSIKAGCGGDSQPKFTLPTCILHERNESPQFCKRRDSFSNQQFVYETRPMNSNGLIENWDDMEEIWNYIFTDKFSNISLDNFKLFLTHSTTSSKQNEKTAEIMYETFNIHSLHFSNSTKISIFSTGTISGTVVDCGYSGTAVTTLIDGVEVPKSYYRSEYGGEKLDKHLCSKLNYRGYNIPEIETDILRDIREKYCYVPLNYNEEIKKPIESFEESYALPDGQTIVFDQEKYATLETLFQPALFHLKQNSLCELIVDSLSECSKNQLKWDETIVLSGGGTMSKGFLKRLKQELSSQFPGVKMVTKQNNANNAWNSAAMLSALSSFDNMWVTKQSYDERGVDIISEMSQEF